MDARPSGVFSGYLEARRCDVPARWAVVRGPGARGAAGHRRWLRSPRAQVRSHPVPNARRAARSGRRTPAEGPKIEKVLDICCGTGAALRRWAHLYDEGVGVDFSEGMLDQARQFVPPAGTTLRFHQTDVLRWTPAEVDGWGGPFDVVTSFGAFGHFEPDDQPSLLALVRHVLKPGGRFVFVTGPAPRASSPVFWAAHGFNAVMRVRNAVMRPPFIMYYLTFSLPEALERCRVAGLEPTVTPLGWAPRPDLVLVQATRPA
ncbi:MAG: class I SAM-dependent methyltransferase [Myxococcota bacterium]